METLIGDNVKFLGNPHITFNPRLIDYIKVQSVYQDKFENCEFIGFTPCGDNGPGIWGNIGDHIHFELYDNETRFCSDIFSTKKIFKKPSTIWEFAIMIDEYVSLLCVEWKRQCGEIEKEAKKENYIQL